MTTPRFKEHPFDRMERLSLGRPHIGWLKEKGEWLAYSSCDTHGYDDAVQFTIAQDARWTPRMKK